MPSPLSMTVGVERTGRIGYEFMPSRSSPSGLGEYNLGGSGLDPFWRVCDVCVCICLSMFVSSTSLDRPELCKYVVDQVPVPNCPP